MQKSEKSVLRLVADPALCLGCKTCEAACAVERGSVSKNKYDAVHEAVRPRARVYVQWDGDVSFPLQCRHCDEAGCLEICPSGALARDAETQLVTHDTERCIGCWMCVMTCPYGVIRPESLLRSVEKCDQCFNRADGPYCRNACPTGALRLLDKKEFDELLAKKRAAQFPQFNSLMEDKNA